MREAAAPLSAAGNAAETTVYDVQWFRMRDCKIVAVPPFGICADYSIAGLWISCTVAAHTAISEISRNLVRRVRKGEPRRRIW